ncbi:unnamed protein product [Echinostoma caproni]|uniref:RPN13_C domain-containing protein n=1 Tax=Echinostoma caproni TaxID=27848 RepID=A0A183B8G9_9TREM|nr:unnamed protein product [Echinostoma caproni]
MIFQSFSAAFQSGDLAPVLAQFKLGAKADEAARHGDLVAFSHALQANAGSSSSKSDVATKKDENKSKKPNDDSSPDKKDGAGTAMETD